MSNQGVNKGRRNLLIGATSVVGAVGVIGAAVPFVRSWAPSAKAQSAGAPVAYDYTKLEVGQQITVEWRGKPVWVMRRDDKMLQSITKSEALVADPASEKPQQPEYCKNEYRSIEPDIFVAVGICTHLGCSPQLFADAGSLEGGWLGGYYCPCHGSKFDLAGRVYSGVPANANLEVPPYTIDTAAKMIVIGEEGGA
ncbi:ubiquinol-cytochrome c reductase iron-sulfur subunit [Kangiella profundi]|uniref:Ubiquinol-cytochrome c reductase iron-sulfur subunit n=1 Tax=Kangiella profundi TaxID=1561924 RepID=A0A2K9AA15_9GAMM|nr:ubiquinol-cytochrome c reductase iron-sulfur subunit [Kangiella profundi]AUD78267.1 ubiquinol-cytochrome c reductase iron-sulfur subunit [Kangiella profundi]GGF06668.1 ubiquinol-cytochrome c reductase iron-sulfur subunit [Kangiella profundi]